MKKMLIYKTNIAVTIKDLRYILIGSIKVFKYDSILYIQPKQGTFSSLALDLKDKISHSLEDNVITITYPDKEVSIEFDKFPKELYDSSIIDEVLNLLNNES